MAKAEIIGGADTPSGRAADIVQCTCGHKNYFAVWSWAGNRRLRCKRCRKLIDYRTLEVEARTTKDLQRGIT